MPPTARKTPGLLNLAAQVEKDGNTLVLDGGDSLQGTPLTQYYLEHRGQWPIHPVAAAFNAMGWTTSPWATTTSTLAMRPSGTICRPWTAYACARM